MFSGVVRGRGPLQCGMGSDLVIEGPPRFDFVPGIGQREEPIFIQTFLPESSIERFYRCVVGPLLRGNSKL